MGAPEVTYQTKGRLTEIRAVLPAFLLVLAGIIGLGFSVIYCGFWVLGSLMAGSFGMPEPMPNVLEYALVFAPLVTFSSYIWLAVRPWKVPALVLWGVIAHLPFLRFFPHAQEHLQIFVIVVGLIFAMLVYANYVWSIHQRSNLD